MKAFDFVVLGATGLQGRIAAKDLLKNGYSVLLCGRDKKRVAPLLKKYDKTSFEYVEMRDLKKVISVLKKSKTKIVVNCVEGDWNLEAMKACIAANAHYLDLGAERYTDMTKKQLARHGLFQKKGLISITGCGSVPGIGNVMLNYASKRFDQIKTIEAGFSWDSNIKKFVVPFSIQSIIEEINDPAPILEQRRWKMKIPLKNVRYRFHRGIGRQKEFLAKHPETYTFYHYFKNWGLENIRFYSGFPAHSLEKLISIIELGLGSSNEIEIKGIKIKPIEFVTEVLKDLERPQGYREKENLWVDIYGTKDNKEKRILMECLVPTLRGWEDAGCNIDTGMPISIMAQMIKKGEIARKGSFAPEGIVPPEPFFKELRKRKMRVLENGQVIN